MSGSQASAGCAGAVFHAAGDGSQTMEFWSKRTAIPAVCIGTVEDAEFEVLGNGHMFRLRVWSIYNASHERLAFQNYYPGTKHTSDVSIIVGLHQEFGAAAYPHVEVCGAWVATSNHNSVQVTPVCSTVTY